jgi:hypothetical protein
MAGLIEAVAALGQPGSPPPVRAWWRRSDSRFRRVTVRPSDHPTRHSLMPSLSHPVANDSGVPMHELAPGPRPNSAGSLPAPQARCLRAPAARQAGIMLMAPPRRAATSRSCSRRRSARTYCRSRSLRLARLARRCGAVGLMAPAISAPWRAARTLSPSRWGSLMAAPPRSRSQCRSGPWRTGHRRPARRGAGRRWRFPRES